MQVHLCHNPGTVGTYRGRAQGNLFSNISYRFTSGEQFEYFKFPARKKFVYFFFRIPLNDTTNAFKAYRRTVIDGCRPLLAPHFNLTVEIPLKAIVRGFTWTVTPISWQNRKHGVAKLKIKEMGSRYLFICAYVWLEKQFSRGDYYRREAPAVAKVEKDAGVVSSV